MRGSDQHGELRQHVTRPRDLHQRLLSAMLVCSLWVAAACRSMRTVDPVLDPAAPAFASVELGDTVEVQTREQKRIRFVVREVDNDAIVSVDGARYTRGEIVQLKREAVSGSRTVWLTIGLTYLLGGILGAFL